MNSVCVRAQTYAVVELLLDSDVLDRLSIEPQSFRAPSGRTLTFDVWGDPQGQPCFWFHGSPSCRLEAVLLDAMGRRDGFRFIASDRPGIGGSSSAPGWSMLDYADDVAALADDLGLSQFSVAGGSGGGPFVLALAVSAPERIHRAVSLACAGAFELDGIKDQIGWVDRLGAWAAPVPGVLATYFGALALTARVPEAIAIQVAKPFAGRLPGQDDRLVAIFLRVLREATRRGLSGIVEDTQVLHRPWGFDVASIRIPVDYVNGTKDEFVPFGYGAELAERTPQSKLHIEIDGDHFSTIFNLDRLRRLLA